LESIDTLIATTPEPERTLREFADAAGATLPAGVPQKIEPGEAVVWRRRTSERTFTMKVLTGKTERRHKRKYAEGNIGKDPSSGR
jgi:hypothetical protein